MTFFPAFDFGSKMQRDTDLNLVREAGWVCFLLGPIDVRLFCRKQVGMVVGSQFCGIFFFFWKFLF